MPKEQNLQSNEDDIAVYVYESTNNLSTGQLVVLTNLTGLVTWR